MIKTLLRWTPPSAPSAAEPDPNHHASAFHPPAHTWGGGGGFNGGAAPTTIALAPARHDPPSAGEIEQCRLKQRFLWLDVEDPTAEEFAELQRAFHLHPLAVEDALRAHQRPKVDEYPEYYFIVCYAVDLDPRGDVTLQQISLFLGESFLITVHRGPAPEIAESAARWERNQVEVGRSLGAVVYSLLDALVDHYFPVIDAIVDRIDAVEEEILERPTRASLATLFQLKRSLLALRRVLAPERDVLNVLIRRDAPIVDAQTGLYLQDVYDHVLRAVDTVDLYRDMLATTLDAYLSVTSNNLNVVMKRMTAISTILMSVALVTGIYGMNFKTMPELDWSFGYPYYALGLMLTVGVSLALFFRRIDWL